MSGEKCSQWQKQETTLSRIANKRPLLSHWLVSFVSFASLTLGCKKQNKNVNSFTSFAQFKKGRSSLHFAPIGHQQLLDHSSRRGRNLH